MPADPTATNTSTDTSLLGLWSKYTVDPIFNAAKTYYNFNMGGIKAAGKIAQSAGHLVVNAEQALMTPIDQSIAWATGKPRQKYWGATDKPSTNLLDAGDRLLNVATLGNWDAAAERQNTEWQKVVQQ